MIISDGKQKLSEAFESFIKFKAFNTMSISDIAWSDLFSPLYYLEVTADKKEQVTKQTFRSQ